MTTFKTTAALCAAIIASSASFAKDGDVILDGFKDASKYTLNQDLGKIEDADLIIDCTARGGKSFNHVLTTKRGLFKPQTFYTLSFDCVLPEQDAENYLHTFVRNSITNNPSSDLGYANSQSTFGKPSKKKIVFKTPDNAEDFSYFIAAHSKARAKISNLKIVEGNGEGFIAVGKNAAPYNLNRQALPSGAKEFDIDAPRNPHGAVVYAADFGLKTGECNFVKALNNAIAHCKKIGAKKLVVEKGVYFSREKNLISLVGLEDFEFDGGGATFVFGKREGLVNMLVRDCLRVKIGNFNFDWDWQTDPLASIVEVVGVKKDKDEAYADYKFVEYDKFPRRDVRVANLSSYDPKTKSVGREGGFGLGYEFFKGTNRPKTQWLSDNVLRVYSSVGHIAKIEKGQLFRMQHYYYDMGGFILENNRHMLVKNINVWSCAGHAFVIGGQQKYWRFDNVNIVRPQNTPRRAITCSADHLHITRSCGFFKMENCEFSLGADDCVNMHDCSNFCRKVSDKVVRTKNSGGFPKGTKVAFRQGDYSPANFVGTVKSSKQIEGEKRAYEIEFEESLPEQLHDGFIMFDTRYDTRNIIVRNCHFHDNRARGILILARDVTIENCRFFHNEMGAIKIETGYTFNVWSEGYGVENVVIRNNSFHTSNPLDVKNSGRARDMVMSVYMKTDPSQEQTMYPILNNILVDSNTFVDSFGLIAFIASTGNVTITGNTFINLTPRKNPFEYRGEFFVTHSANTRIVNNTWVESAFVPAPA